MNFLHRTWAEISESALVNNLSEVKKNASGAFIFAVVKADAYGHSAALTAPILDKAGVDGFAVSNIEEARALRELNIKKPVLVLGYTPVDCVRALAENDISQCVYSSDYARLLSENAAAENLKIKVHIKLDTGMGRIGFDLRDDGLSGVNEAVAAAKLPGFITEGVFTHFAVADSREDSATAATAAQYARFERGANAIKQAVGDIPYIHSDNSAAVCQKEYCQTAVRPGIILYGLSPDRDFEAGLELKPVMTVKSVVSLVKTIKAGATLSYGMTYTAKSDMRVATVAAGYADGYPRLLSGKGEVLIGGKKARILGRVCMDQMIVDVTGIKDVKMGDEVVLFGDTLSADRIAELADTINYEIVCGIAPRVPRVLVK